jgi:hypothetical protein
MPTPDDTPTDLDLDQIDLLAVWRSVPISGIGPETLQRLQGALIAFTRAKYPDGEIEELLLRAQARDAAAWTELCDLYLSPTARLFGQELEILDTIDRHCSCLLIAVSLGSRPAAVLLALRLAGTEPHGVDHDVRLQALLELSRMARFGGDAAYSIHRALFYSETSVAGNLEKQPNGSGLFDAPDPDDTTTMQVLLQKPARATDKDLRALLETFKPLEAPYPLKPTPPVLGLIDALRREFPWSTAAIDEVAIELTLARRLGRPTFWLPPLLLVGEPGVGKSTFARRLAVLAEVPHETLIAGGSSDSRSLSGTARGWGTAAPCFPLEVIRRTGVANPILVVEEIDRSGGSSRNGRLTDKLITMLDPKISQSFLDECLQVQTNLSAITWILTANRLDRVPPALRSRCRIIRFDRPRPSDFEVLLGGILRDFAESYRVEVGDLPELRNDVLTQLRAGFTSGRLQARQLAQLVHRTLGLQGIADSIEPVH